MSITPKIFDELDRIAPLIPTPIYWLDTNYVIVGGNDVCLEAIGSNASSMRDALIGKTYYDYYPKEIAEALTRAVKEVLETRQLTKTEEKIVDIKTGKFRYYETGRSPLFDDDNKLIGTICSAIEITDKKEKKRLELENQSHMVRAEEDEKFRQIAGQVVHDIRSPLATMQMILKHCEIHPENARIALNQSASRIQDISYQLLNRFSPHNFNSNNADIDNTSESPLNLVSAAILEMIAAKRFEYNDLSIDFIANINQDAYFAFIDIDTQAFKRMLSNLINNAVDALKGIDGTVSIHLAVVNDNVIISIEDNGCGIPESIKNKILNNIDVTAAKSNGHGLGFAQIRKTINTYQGSLAIESESNNSTKIIITFPKSTIPDWIAQKIIINSNDIIVILDDDPSIHVAWDTRFKNILPNFICKHFENGVDAISFINSLKKIDKDRVFLLSDYELLKQEINGLDVIEKTNITRSILVTSHHNNKQIRDKVNKLNTKILPKPLAAEVRIIVSHNTADSNANQISNNLISDKPNKIELVVVDDDKTLTNTLVGIILKNKKVDVYNKAEQFLEVAKNYPLNTKFLIDMEFKGEEINGIEVLKKLHNLGFNDLNLYTGWSLKQDEVPSYINVILKTDLNAVLALVGK